MALASVSFEIDFTIDNMSRSRKAALSSLGQRIGLLRTPISAQDITGCFLARETLGSTAIGSGVAAPHTILTQTCPPLVQVTHLKYPVDFEANDAEPVDVLLSVVGNRHDLRWLHLALPRFAKLAYDPELAARLRAAKTASEVEDILASLGIYSDRTLPKEAA